MLRDMLTRPRVAAGESDARRDVLARDGIVLRRGGVNRVARCCETAAAERRDGENAWLRATVPRWLDRAT